jgi:hypothetical protein
MKDIKAQFHLHHLLHIAVEVFGLLELMEVLEHIFDGEIVLVGLQIPNRLFIVVNRNQFLRGKVMTFLWCYLCWFRSWLCWSWNRSSSSTSWNSH